jgi:uncharacterized protein YbaP (TraB family)
MFGESFVNFHSVIKKKLNASQLVITEAKIDRQNIAAYFNARSSSDSVSNILPKQDVEYITKILNNTEINISKFTPGELFLRLQMNYPKYKCAVMNSADKYVLDEYLQYLGNRKKKKLHYLETDSFQLDKIKDITKGIDWAFFKKRVPSLLARYRAETTDESLCMLANQYASFTVDYTLTDTCKTNGVDEALINKRNDEWMQQLPESLNRSNCFIALGLAHFYKKCGIIERLRKMGYHVEEVDMRSGKK